jgi:hypothetical protein
VVSLQSWDIRPPGGEATDEAIHVADTPQQAVDWLLARLEKEDGPHRAATPRAPSAAGAVVGGRRVSG